MLIYTLQKEAKNEPTEKNKTIELVESLLNPRR
jgi:hypothetical protein